MAENRMIWLDTLRLIAGVSMVGLHASSDALGQPFANFEFWDRLPPLLLRAVIYTARTELFLIISLFLLLLSLDKRPRGYGAVIAVQSRRLLVPFAFWTVFYAFYNLNKSASFGYQDWVWAQLATPQVWLDYILLGSSKYHMHFIPTLFGLVLFYPFFIWAKRWPILGLLVIAALLVKRVVDVNLWGTYYDQEWLPYAIRAVKILTYCGYGMVAGALVGLWQRGTNIARWALPIIACGGVLFAFKLYATYLTAMTGQWPYNFTLGYWADFLMPVLLFLICMAFAHKHWPQWIVGAAKYSFGIYLCHPIFLDLIEIYTHGQNFTPIQIVTIKIVFAMALTIGFVWGLARLPVLAWTIGLGPLPFAEKFNPVKKAV